MAPLHGQQEDPSRLSRTKSPMPQGQSALRKATFKRGQDSASEAALSHAALSEIERKPVWRQRNGSQKRKSFWKGAKALGSKGRGKAKGKGKGKDKR